MNTHGIQSLHFGPFETRSPIQSRLDAFDNSWHVTSAIQSVVSEVSVYWLGDKVVKKNILFRCCTGVLGLAEYYLLDDLISAVFLGPANSVPHVYEIFF